MSTRLIPREEWPAFLEEFARTHRGWITTIERLGRGTMAPRSSDGRPLGSIEVKPQDTHIVTIDIFFEVRAADGGVRIENPVEVRLELSPDGAARALQIEDDEGSLVRMESTAHRAVGTDIAPHGA